MARKACHDCDFLRGRLRDPQEPSPVARARGSSLAMTPVSCDGTGRARGNPYLWQAVAAMTVISCGMWLRARRKSYLWQSAAATTADSCGVTPGIVYPVSKALRSK